MQAGKRSVVVLTLLLLAGCRATIQDVIRTKELGGGTAQVYDVSQNKALEITKSVFRESGAGFMEEYPAEGCVLTGASDGLSPGTLMGAWIERVDARSTKVTVVTKRFVPTSLFTVLTEGTFHRRFGDKVKAMTSDIR